MSEFEKNWNSFQRNRDAEEQRKSGKHTSDFDDVISELDTIGMSIPEMVTGIRKELQEIRKHISNLNSPPSYTFVLWVIAALLFLNLVRH
jgi:hypothetical protein